MRLRNCGKPHHGLEYDDMNSSRARFKLKFRDCLRNEGSMKADAIALKLRNRANSGEKSMRSIIRKRPSLILQMVVLALLILLNCGENILWAYLIQSTTPHIENM